MLTPEIIGNYALEALLIEVAVTPKPGLVDRNNSGAHQDTDFFTFQISAAALAPYFVEFARAGYHADQSPDELLKQLRPLGLQAEQAMFARTNDVNTHKGAIFSLGLLCAAAGRLCRKSCKNSKHMNHHDICHMIRRMCEGLCERELSAIHSAAPMSHGERVYFQYAMTGARGQAESGYEVIERAVYPYFKTLQEKNLPLNTVMCGTLLKLMGCVLDTNVAARHDMSTVQVVQTHGRDLSALFDTDPGAAMYQMELLDKVYIRDNISPGGCADLLALCYLLDCLENRGFSRKGRADD